MTELIDLDEARALVLARTPTLPDEPVALGKALGRVLALDAFATAPVPPFDSSAMDGFAVLAEDTLQATPHAPVTLRILGESRAGTPASVRLRPGEAIRISTGAMMPQGASAIVRLEDARAEGETVELSRAAVAGQDVRRAGEDIASGARVISRGTPLGPAELGVLASLGEAEVRCARRPQVAVVSTGDELLEPGEPYRPGGVRDSNAYSISALVQRSGGVVRLRDSVRDDAASTRAAIAPALEQDLLVVCGGVSVGEHDHVRAALADLGVEQVFWGIGLRPGKPTWFGVAPGGTLVFGLPGNPVSAIVTFLLLARPALRSLQGADPDRDRARAVFDADYRKAADRTHAVRCRLQLRDDGWHATPTGEQGSHILSSMLGADALALIPRASTCVGAGDRVEIELLPRE